MLPKPARLPNKGRAYGSPFWVKWLLIGLVLAYVGIIIVLPLAALVDGAFANGVPAIISALSKPDVLSAFWRTFIIGIGVMIVHGVFGLMVAWVLVRHKFRGRAFFNGLIDLPFALSPVVAGYMLLILFGRRGIFAPLMEQFDIKIAFAMPGMFLATLFVTLPFMVRELMPVLQAFGTDQEQAAATIGANGWQSFWYVTFPALRWAFIYGITLTFARALGEFGAVLVVGGGVQGQTETATLYIFRALDDREYVGAYSAALVLGILSLIMVVGTDMLRRRQEK